MKKKPDKGGKVISISSRKRVKQPLKRSMTVEEKLEDAYRKLGITAQQVTDCPKITHILHKIPGRKGHAGIKAAVEFLRGVDSDETRKFLSLYDDMPPTIHALLPFEAFCLAAGLTTKRMFEIVMGACLEQSDAATKLIAATAHPAVVTATVKAAIQPGGHQDRKMLHLNKGFLPVPKNQTTILSGNARQNNLMITDNSQQTTYSVGEIVGIEKRQERIADRFNERLGLGSGRPVEANRYDTGEPEPIVEPEPGEPDAIDVEPEPVVDWT